MSGFGKRTALNVRHEPVDPDIQLLGDPRGEDRQPIDLQGVCITSSPPQRLACSIVDMSGSGAKLQFAATDTVPDAFMIHVASMSVMLECRVVWRTATQLGVEHTIRPLA